MKREDLQSIRGFAILLVLLFHIFPAVFVNGFAGVDIFFVLSGYLMAMVYQEKTTTLWSFIHFYKKRFLRLLPIYSLAVLAVLPVGMSLLVAFYNDSLKKEAIWSLVLSRNVWSMLEYRTYWDQVSQYKFLLHAWSLGVEMQFYLLVPFLFYAENHWPQARYFNDGLSVLSLLYHLYVSGVWEFHLFFARIWEFQLGIVSWRYSPRNDRKDYQKLPQSSDDQPQNEELSAEGMETQKSTVYAAFSILLLMLLLPETSFQLSDKIVRLFSTTISAVLFSFGGASVPLLANTILSFLGDISYVLYLIHWPILIFLRSNFDVFQFSLLHGCALIAVLVFISTLLHYGVEKPLLKNIPLAVTITSIAYLLSAWMIWSSAPISGKEAELKQQADFRMMWESLEPNSSWSRMEIEKNAVFSNQFIANHRDWRIPSSACQKSSNSSLKVLILGNSFAMRGTTLVADFLGAQCAEIKLVTAEGWEPLDRNHKDFVYNFNDYYERRMPEVYGMKADVVFLIHRFFYEFRTEPITGDLSEDKLTQDCLKEMLKLSETTKLIFWTGLRAKMATNVPAWLAQVIHSGLNYTAKNDYPYEAFLDQHKNSIARVNYIVDHCPKCVWFDMQAPLCNEEKTFCKRFDDETLLSYYSDEFHLSWWGVRKVEPAFVETAARAFDKFGIDFDRSVLNKFS